MCGIAGLLVDPSGSTQVDWDRLEEAMERLTAAPVDPFRPTGQEALFEGLSTQLPALREYSVQRELIEQVDLRERLAAGARALEAWEAAVMAQVEGHGREMSSELMERWNALWVRCRDFTWCVQKDVLGGIERVAKLLPETLAGNDRARFETWKLTATLENMGRLEVRGRDSLGISWTAVLSRQQYQALLGWLAEAGLDEEWTRRREAADLVDRSILEDVSGQDVKLVFTFKVAQEVGALGDNVSHILRDLREDRIFWQVAAQPGTRTNLFAHTRWASNGIISEPNCHPVTEHTVAINGRSDTAPSSPHRIMVALNGDVDNYQGLCARLAAETGRAIAARISTDAKIIPVLVDYHFQKCGDMRLAFCRAVAECEGSIAVVMHNTREPGRVYLALRGSGQSLYVGLGPHGYVYASELYGVVEQTSRFVRMDGVRERVSGQPDTAGQVFVLDSDHIAGLEGISAWSFDGEPLPLEGTVKTAEITTRDINRGDFPHFFLKEISEAPESVRKTLRGKFSLFQESERYSVRMNLGEDVVPRALLDRFRDGSLRRIYLIGQGTAAIAGQAVATRMTTLVGPGKVVCALKATELSGYLMDKDLGDALIIAISQSGTTTDTNRTVDMARARGAAVIGIVNRRNSDLVYKVDGVLYTSDGRDIEMSVASTKAFYSQVVAGYLLAYQLALAGGTASEEEIYHELRELDRLPDLMGSVLADHRPIQELAEQWAPARSDWAVVGSGSTRAAADELRIKLSELCYKSIAVDYIEDKKHIDLSSEPLTVVCAAGLGLMALKDAVKEVAIFKSHKSVPIVICSEGFDAFEPYAAGVLYVPKASESASVLLNALVGHLWGYYCALAIDRGAEQLRPARALAVEYLTGEPSAMVSPSLWRKVITIGRRFQEDLLKGRFNSSLSVDIGSKLSMLFQYFTGAHSLRQFGHDFQTRGTAGGLAETMVNVLSQAIHQLGRPIDAIKHQAKTITVGISRLEESFEGVILDALREHGLPLDAAPYRDLVTLRALSRAVRSVTGTTCYKVDGLGSLGEPAATSTVRVITKTGLSAGMVSRADRSYSLLGTKEWAVRTCSVYVGKGRKDGRPIVIVPLVPRGQVEKLVLLHLEFHPELPIEQKVTLLRDFQQRYDDLKSHVMETDLEWDDQYLEPISPEALVTLPVDKLAEQVLVNAQRSVGC
ncbi:MAG: SIS domain-containing protein [Armatimonadetes bacterium]|nr:SIS domain-containing protein [Armatimonadota bacterium]